MAFLPSVKQKCTYIKNGFRTDITGVPSAMGQGVPLNPFSIYSVTPLFYASGSLTAAVTYANLVNNTFPLLNKIQIPGMNNSVVPLDCLRCLSFTISVDSTATPTFNITGYDDRFRKIVESISITNAIFTAANATITSRHAYLYIESVTTSGDWGGGGTIAIQPSNQYFGLPYYTGLTKTNILTAEYSQTTLPPASIIGGLNFYNAAPTSATIANILDPVTNPAISYDARGLYKLAASIGANNMGTHLFSFYNYGADSWIQAQLSQNSYPNGSYPPSVLQYQTQVMGMIPNAPVNPAVTSLSEFDLYGAQYPGDLTNYNKLFPTHPMV